MGQNDRSKLAIFGGEPACSDLEELPWPITTTADEDAVLAVLRTGNLVADRIYETAVDRFEAAWAEHLGVSHCVAVSNGTVAIEIALRALGVDRNSEVIVPTLSFIASAMAVANLGAKPIYADIDPRTYNIDPDLINSLITVKTKAILVVHLHGLPADMSAISAIAQEHGIPLIEDAAQAQGSLYMGSHCGTLSDVGTFSLQMTKNLPTCGEGGMVVTNNNKIASELRRLRQFGELIEIGKRRTYQSSRIGTNAKMSAIQAAYAQSQLNRFPAYDQSRKQNVRTFLNSLSDLPQIGLPFEPEGYTHSWHIIRFGMSEHGALSRLNVSKRRQMVMRALAAENIPISRYQVLPLPEQPSLRSLTDQNPMDWRHATRVLADTFTLQRRHLHPDADKLLSAYAFGFKKVFTRLEELEEI